MQLSTGVARYLMVWRWEQLWHEYSLPAVWCGEWSWGVVQGTHRGMVCSCGGEGCWGVA